MGLLGSCRSEQLPVVICKKFRDFEGLEDEPSCVGLTDRVKRLRYEYAKNLDNIDNGSTYADDCFTSALCFSAPAPNVSIDPKIDREI